MKQIKLDQLKEQHMVERVKFLGVVITSNLSWSTHVDAMIKKAQHHYFLRRLKKFGMSIKTLINFRRCTVESILSGRITARYGSYSAQDRKELQSVMNTAYSIMRANLPSIDSVSVILYSSFCSIDLMHFE
eukprot:g24740.t1